MHGNFRLIFLVQETHKLFVWNIESDAEWNVEVNHADENEFFSFPTFHCVDRRNFYYLKIV